MTRVTLCVLFLLLVVSEVHSQTTSQPFASVDQAVKAQRAGWDGDKSQLSAAFAAERRALGDKFEPELSVLYDEQGKVISARATSGHQLLRTVAEQAARQSTFTPTKLRASR